MGKKLREIERKKYDAHTFLEELKQMVSELVNSVLCDNTNHRITVEVPKADPEPTKKKRTKAAAADGEKPAPKKRASRKKKEEAVFQPAEGVPCPVCGEGTLIKGKSAWGCSRWKEGCEYRKSFE